MKQLLTIGHSYVVALNRRLAHEMALAGAGRWDVTVVAPKTYRGDLRTISVETIPSEASRLVTVHARLDRVPHLTWYSGGMRELLRRRWDVVHCWEEPYVLASAQVAALVRRETAFVFSTFQNIAKKYPPPLSTFETRTLTRANGWIAFGQSIDSAQRERLSRYRDLPSRIIPPGVEPSVFRPDRLARAQRRAELDWSDDVPVIGFTGRFIAAKGADTLIAAAERVTVPWRALFVGGGGDRTSIDAFAARHPGRVAVVGNATHDQMPGWLNAMDVLCAPSRTTPEWREQFGRMLIEGMACGVPVIASDSGEIPHVVGDAGRIVPESDVDAWARALEDVLASADRRREMADRGRDRVLKRFTWAVAAEQHLKFFEALT